MDSVLPTSKLEPRVAQVASMAAAREVELDADERRELAMRLGSLLVGGGMLAVGWAWAYFQPSQASVGAIVQLMAVVIVAWPVFQQAAEGFIDKDPGSYTEQLVALAILAAVVIGDFVTAGMVPILMEVGHLLEERSVMGARAAIEGVKKLLARDATLFEAGHERVVDPEDPAGRRHRRGAARRDDSCRRGRGSRSRERRPGPDHRGELAPGRGPRQSRIRGHHQPRRPDSARGQGGR